MKNTATLVTFIVGVVLGLITSQGAEEKMSAWEYLDTLESPQFREGHTLPPLTRWGYTGRIPLKLRVALARDWGYALEAGTVQKVAAKMDDPDSVQSKIVSLVEEQPQTYRLSVVYNHPLNAMKDLVPGEAWTRDEEGELVGGKKIWSPEVPDEALREMGEKLTVPLRKLRKRVPVAMILSGGESGLGIVGQHREQWQQDPRIVGAKGERSWFEYISASKARQELIVAKAMRTAAPDRLFYLYYATSGGTHRNRYGGWKKWAIGYRWFRGVSDIPNSSLYYKHYNTGWTGDNDLLTQVLNARGNEISFGNRLAYNWVCGGWVEGKLSDIDRYTGFLKSCYTAGMIGAVAGYFAVPEGGYDPRFTEPPHWLRQMIALGRVHALFSRQEDFLRDGYLLQGPDRHTWSKDQPAYEFPTGDPDVRVLARKKRFSPEWLITAWAAGGEARDVTVTIPELGEVLLHARPDAGVYLGTVEDGEPVLTPAGAGR